MRRIAVGGRTSTMQFLIKTKPMERHKGDEKLRRTLVGVWFGVLDVG